MAIDHKLRLTQDWMERQAHVPVGGTWPHFRKAVATCKAMAGYMEVSDQQEVNLTGWWYRTERQAHMPVGGACPHFRLAMAMC